MLESRPAEWSRTLPVSVSFSSKSRNVKRTVRRRTINRFAVSYAISPMPTTPRTLLSRVSAIQSMLGSTSPRLSRLSSSVTRRTRDKVIAKASSATDF